MSWPDKLSHVDCIGFPKEWLPVIADAVDNQKVKWGKNDLFIDLGTAQFEWADCTWEMTEMRECVRSISLLKGKPNAEDLTAAVLRG
jgi:hypothetical protein